MTAATIATQQRVSSAMLAWEEGTRRRRLSGAKDRLADAALASGGLVMANAAMTLEMGLPVGRAGLSLGISLIGAGFAWMLRGRPRRIQPQPVAEVRAAAIQEAWRAA